MTKKRVILEMGAGNDLHGGDYTKAACRAVQDALHHSSLTMIRTLAVSTVDMYVDVTIGVPKPDQVDGNAVLATLPHGTGYIKVVQGGLEELNEGGTDGTLIANAIVMVSFDDGN